MDTLENYVNSYEAALTWLHEQQAMALALADARLGHQRDLDLEEARVCVGVEGKNAEQRQAALLLLLEEVPAYRDARANRDRVAQDLAQLEVNIKHTERRIAFFRLVIRALRPENLEG